MEWVAEEAAGNAVTIESCCSFAKCEFRESYSLKTESPKNLLGKEGGGRTKKNQQKPISRQIATRWKCESWFIEQNGLRHYCYTILERKKNPIFSYLFLYFYRVVTFIWSFAATSIIEINASCFRSFPAIWFFNWSVQQVGTFLPSCRLTIVISIRNSSVQKEKEWQQ